jgi:hypothetical protein
LKKNWLHALLCMLRDTWPNCSGCTASHLRPIDSRAQLPHIHVSVPESVTMTYSYSRLGIGNLTFKGFKKIEIFARVILGQIV